MNNEPNQEFWQSVWERIDRQFLMLTYLLREDIPHLYIEQGNASNRHCLLSAYFAVANPKHGDIAQIDSADMVGISVDVSRRDNGLVVKSFIDKGIVLRCLPEEFVRLDQQSTAVENEILQIIAQIEEFIQHSSPCILQALI